MATSPRRRLEIFQINFIRALAMLGIFWHHLWKGLPHTPDPGPAYRLLHLLFDWGALGVIVFNIMSGFVLALPFFGPDGGRPAPTYRDFLSRRFLRICPAYYIALVVFSLINAVITANTDVLGILEGIAERLLFLQTLDYGSFLTNIAAFWWLGLLAQFYFLFPLLVRLYQAVGPTRATLSILAACWTMLLVLGHSASTNPSLGGINALIYFNLPARLPEFAIGVWLAASWRPGEKVIAGLPFARPFSLFILGAAIFAVAGGAFILTLSPAKTYPLALFYQVACCFALFILMFISPAASRLGRNGSVAALAAASYSIYLVHQPILSYFNLAMGDAFGPVVQFCLLSAAGGGLCYGAAILLDRLAARILDGRASGPAPASSSRR